MIPSDLSLDTPRPTAASTLSDWLNYMQHIHVSAIDMGLSRVLPVAEHLGLVQSAKDDVFVFTVAGTNGKGSTTAVISEICQQAGYKTALYQSPHLIDFNERVRINGEPVGDDVLVEAFCQVEQARLACELTLSFFEMTTLAAMLIFAEANCDIWVLEVGLGGRLDVVNIIDPDMAVITNIGIDHTDWLGETREQIGYEKAGILREGIPLIYGDSDMPRSVQEQIQRLGVTCYQAQRDFVHFECAANASGFTNTSTKAETNINTNAHSNSDINAKTSQNTMPPDLNAGSMWQFSCEAVTMQLPKPALSLINTSNAIAAVLASPLDIAPHHITDALHNVNLAGRMDQRTLENRRWLFDVAHNAEGVSFILLQLTLLWQQHLRDHPTGRLHLLFSMLADKPIKEVVNCLLASSLPIAHWHIAPIDHPRAADSKVMTDIISVQMAARDGKGDISLYDDLTQASLGVRSATSAEDLIVVCGSFHTIGEVLLALKGESHPNASVQ